MDVVGGTHDFNLPFDQVRDDYPPQLPHEWTQNELRNNGIQLDMDRRGLSVFRLIGFQVELSPRVSRGRFVVTEKIAEANGQMVRGLVDFIAEGVGSVSGALASETQRVVGIVLNRSYLQPAYVGQEVTVVARPLNVGGSGQVWEVKFETERLKGSKSETVLIAAARLTLVVLPYKALENLAPWSKL